MTTAIDLFIKATLILALGHLAVLALRSYSASTKHLIAATALAALLILPILSRTMPTRTIEVLPPPVEDATEETATLPALLEATADPEAGPRVGSESVRTDEILVQEGASEEFVTGWTTSEYLERSGTSDVQEAGVVSPTTATQPSAPVRGMSLSELARDFAGSIAWWPILRWVWLIGALFVLVRFITGILRISWIASNATRADRSAQEIASMLSREMKTPRQPEVRLSDGVDVPLVWGFANPVILLPQSSRVWDTDRLRTVLTHEMAHVARHDCTTLLVGQLTTILYWFHPLSWTLEQTARRLAERACDDVVVSKGEAASDYASHILEIARQLPERDRYSSVALAMSRRSEIEGRLLAILEPLAERTGMTFRKLVAVSSVALVAVATLAAFRLGAAPAPDEDLAAAQMATSGTPGVTIDVEAEPLITEEESSEAWAWSDFDPDFFDFVEKFASDQNYNVNTNSNYNYNINVDNNGNVTGRTYSGRKSKEEGEEAWDRAWELHNEEEWAEAAALFAKAARLGYRPGTSEYNAACGYARLRNADQALVHLEASLRAGFDEISYFFQDDDLDPIRSNPKFQAFLERVESAAVEGKRAKAMSHSARVMAEYESLRKTSSGDVDDWNDLGYQLLKLRRLDAGVDALQRAHQLSNGQSTRAMYNLACAYALSGRESTAIDWLERAVSGGLDRVHLIEKDADLDSLRDNPRFRDLLARARRLSMDRFHFDNDHQKTARYREAIDEYRKYVEENPESGRGWSNLGFAYHYTGNYDQAIAAFSRALQLGYQTAYSAYNIACGHARLGHTDLAFQWLDRAESYGMDVGHRLESDEDLRSLRSDPRYREVIRSSKSRQKSSHCDDCAELAPLPPLPPESPEAWQITSAGPVSASASAGGTTQTMVGVPLPPVAPLAPGAPYGYPGKTSFILLDGDSMTIQNTDDANISGSWNSDDDRLVISKDDRKWVVRGEETVFAMEHQGNLWMITDEDLVDRAMEILEPVSELAHEQRELGREQSAISREQARIVRQQARLADQQSRISQRAAQYSSEQLNAEIRRLADELERLALEQGRLGEKHGKIGSLQSEISGRQAEEARQADEKLRSLLEYAIAQRKARRLD
ncbi:MAG: tetratricopeptide repeat protein [Acidobacteria bacterium]|nr:tetratricopeptide repeat protein [Acidobacteriota bacterium]